MTSTASPQPSTSADLAAAVSALAGAERLLVALDFDGTLAPFVDIPKAARALPEAKAALDRLERLPDTRVAYVSGRPLSSLETVTEADGDALLIGSHGVEIRFGRDGVSLDLAPEEQAALDRLGEVLGALVQSVPGTRLEVKPVGFGVHYRRLEGEGAQDVVARASAAAAAVSGDLTIRDGKDIIEFSVRGADKGDGIDRLREYTKATAVLFAGDDVTDEDGFRVLLPGRGDVGVKVGPGATAAQYRVADERAIAALLTQLAEARAAR
ncbi:trehalose-phosphatase protein [Leifsonia xyli subsp. cynodontis DSM 46306]|uniref:Trehalose 6-phosphate phosphatase n=1 Tax=Leifsonia xyli subsp. cynodontis DSM 46306 TaxID=1389489 RepID=U3P8L1_LEIXC|nr:trehalose-phosphatase [Leifsonia xyli]AGW41814.1 trehalose-phosphatase protein [Leifsonia xyli subsp. cynodontis DSM 46306]